MHSFPRHTKSWCLDETSIICSKVCCLICLWCYVKRKIFSSVRQNGIQFLNDNKELLFFFLFSFFSLHHKPTIIFVVYYIFSLFIGALGVNISLSFSHLWKIVKLELWYYDHGVAIFIQFIGRCLILYNITWCMIMCGWCNLVAYIWCNMWCGDIVFVETVLQCLLFFPCTEISPLK